MVTSVIVPALHKGRLQMLQSIAAAAGQRISKSL